MKYSILLLLLIQFSFAEAQKNKEKDEKFVFVKTGTFFKPKLVPALDKLAVAQATVIFKQATTEEFLENERGNFGGRKSGGSTVTGRLTAYLETSDGDLTDADFQDITDHFYSYFTKKLNENNIKTVEWDKIKATSFYQDYNDKNDILKTNEELKKNGQIAQFFNANKGNTLRHYDPARSMNLAFAMGKQKKSVNFSEEMNATVLLLHAVLDFADIILDGDIKSGESTTYLGAGSTRVTKTKEFKFNSTVIANVKVSAETDWDGKYMGGENYFLNEKNGYEFIKLNQNISSDEKFATEVSKDPNKAVLKRGVFLPLGKNFKAVPVVVVTTRDKYITAAKKALENYSDGMIAFMIESRK